MKQLDKIKELKNTIQFLYEKEGRSINYISKLLEVDRKLLSQQIKEYKFVQANRHKLTPSNQKFVNKHRNHIIKKLNENVCVSKIASELKITRDKLYYLIDRDEKLKEAKSEYDARKTNRKIEQGLNSNYFENLPNEEWKKVLGYPNYYVSNMGRFKKYLPTYDCYKLLAQTPNSRTNRLYVTLYNEKKERKNLTSARIVGFAFCQGYTLENNTIDHIDGDFTNNKASNLRWVTQGQNNQFSYDNKTRKPHASYSRNGKFKEIVINKKYRFKTIVSASKFLDVSEAQFQRYLSGECEFNGTIELIY